MIGIVGSDTKKLKDIENVFLELGCESRVVEFPYELDRVDKIVLAGSGNFDDAMQNLRRGKWDQKIENAVEKGKPLLGICLGMQLLFETGDEKGAREGLGFFPGKALPVFEPLPEREKTPEAGWEPLKVRRESPLFSGLPDQRVYFGKPYKVETEPEFVTASMAFCGIDLTAAVEYDNVYAVQFLPEKSGAAGREILKNFALLESRRSLAAYSPVIESSREYEGDTYAELSLPSFPRH